jgi:Tol biopolymer transport system component
VRGGQAVFSSGTIRSASFVLHLDGRRPDPEALLSTVDVQLQPSLSCDHRWLAYRRVLREEQQVVLRDRVSGEETVIGQGAHEASPLIAPDATRVAFRRGSSIEARPIPDGPPVTLCADCGAPLDWSPDGKRLLYERGGRPSAIGVLNLATGQPSIVVSDTERNLRRAKFSPDGRWIAFHEEDAAGSRIFAVNDAGDRVAIGPKGTSAGCPVWSTDGSLLYFLSNRSGKTAIWAQPLDPRTKQPRGEASLVFESPFSRRSFLEHMDGRHADVGFSLSGGALVFAMDEALANVWTIQLARR